MPDPAPQPILLFRKALDAMRAGVPVPPDASAFMLTSGDVYQAENGRIKLDQAMGLTKGGGSGPWWVQEARERRNGLLRQLHVECFPSLDVTETVDRMLRLAERRRRATTPATTRHEELMDAILRSGAAFPKRQMLRGIIANPPG